MEDGRARKTALALGAGCLALGASMVFVMRRRNKTPREPPVVRIPEKEAADGVKNDQEDFLKRCRKMYGDIFTVNLEGGRRMTFVLDSRLISGILNNTKTLSFTEVSKMAKARFNVPSLLQSPHDVKALSALFRTAMQGATLDAVLQSAQARLTEHLDARLRLVGDGWHEDELWDLVSHVQLGATVDAICGAGFFNSRVRDALFSYDHTVGTRYDAASSSAGADVAGQRQALLDAIEPRALVQNGDGTVSQVLVQLLQHAFGKGCDDVEAKNAVTVLLVGAVINTVPTSFYVLGHTAQDPAVVERLRVEAATLLGTYDPALPPSAQWSKPLGRKELAKAPFADSLVRETLRFRGRSNSYRVVTKETLITHSNGQTYVFKPGMYVSICTRFAHHSPSIVHRPEVFNASRYMPHTGSATTATAATKAAATAPAPASKAATAASRSGREKGAQPAAAAAAAPPPLMPFGGGIGKCPGEAFVYNALKSFVLRLLHCYDVEVVGGDLPPGNKGGIASMPRPVGKAKVRLRRRPAAAAAAAVGGTGAGTQ